MQEEKQEEAIDFTSFLVKPHNKKSRDVTDDDLERVLNEIKTLFNLCYTQVGHYPGAYAMCSPQISSDDPLKLIVLSTKEVLINPEIVNKTKTTVLKTEGCISFADRQPIEVETYNKITLAYNTLTEDGKIGPRVEENVGGKRAQVFIHECRHLGLLGDNLYIYDLY